MSFEQIPSPPPLDSEREAERRKLARTRWLGAVLIPISLGWSWYFILRPFREAQATGQTTYSIKAILMGPVCLYLGIALLAADLRDDQIRYFDANGKKRYTRKGWLVLAGAMIVCGVTLAAWYFALHRIGFTTMD